MAFLNRVRLPLQLFRPQYPEEREVFRLADGTTKTLSSIVRKVYEARTDYMRDDWHGKLKIALSHDTVNIESDNYLGGIVQDGDYTINWPDFLDYPLAPAQFQAEATPFDASNHNCQSCEEATSIRVEDDRYENAYGQLIPLSEGEELVYNVAANDYVCCSPVEWSIVWFDAAYIQSISIDANGIVTFTLRNDLTTASSLELFRYRAECPNGNFDEGSFTAAVQGSVTPCLPPINVTASNITTEGADISWTAPITGTPSGGYEWELFTNADLVNPIQTGTSMDEGPISLSGLNDGTSYTFKVRSVCAYETSTWAQGGFRLPLVSPSCGQYEISWTDGSGDPTTFANGSYVDCVGEPQAIRLWNNQVFTICALQDSPGNPTNITGATDIFYIGLC